MIEYEYFHRVSTNKIILNVLYFYYNIKIWSENFKAIQLYVIFMIISQN